MRQGNFIDGIRAGFQSYMQTRQWGNQMQYGKLAQEQMTMANRMQEQRNADYMSPGQEMDMRAKYNREQTDYAAGLQKTAADEAAARGVDTFKTQWDYRLANPMPTAGEGQKSNTFKGAEPVYDYFNTIAVNAGLPSVSTKTMGEIQNYIKVYGEAGVALGVAAVQRDALMFNKQNYEWLIKLAQSSPDRAGAAKQAIFRAFVDGQTKEQVQQEVVDIIRNQAIKDDLIPPGFGGWGDIVDPQAKEVLARGAGFIADKMPSSAEYNWRSTRR